MDGFVFSCSLTWASFDSLCSLRINFSPSNLLHKKSHPDYGWLCVFLLPDLGSNQGPSD